MEILFCFVKEDLRELREEPTDPQAQQEIINSIEEVYFSNDSFDIVKYELEVSCLLKRKNSDITKNEGQKYACDNELFFVLFLVSCINTKLYPPASSWGCVELLAYSIGIESFFNMVELVSVVLTGTS